jgi:hypothetical protein
MNLRRTCVLLTILALPTQAQIVKPDKACGPKIDPSSVLLIDLRSFQDDSAAGVKFLDAQLAGHKFTLGGHEAVDLGQKRQPIFNKDGDLLTAQKLAASRGCNLLVLTDIERAGTGKYYSATQHTATSSHTNSIEATRLIVKGFFGTKQ